MRIGGPASGIRAPPPEWPRHPPLLVDGRPRRRRPARPRLHHPRPGLRHHVVRAGSRRTPIPSPRPLWPGQRAIRAALALSARLLPLGPHLRLGERADRPALRRLRPGRADRRRRGDRVDRPGPPRPAGGRRPQQARRGGPCCPRTIVRDDLRLPRPDRLRLHPARDPRLLDLVAFRLPRPRADRRTAGRARHRDQAACGPRPARSRALGTLRPRARQARLRGCTGAGGDAVAVSARELLRDDSRPDRQPGAGGDRRHQPPAATQPLRRLAPHLAGGVLAPEPSCERLQHGVRASGVAGDYGGALPAPHPTGAGRGDRLADVLLARCQLQLQLPGAGSCPSS